MSPHPRKRNERWWNDKKPKKKKTGNRLLISLTEVPYPARTRNDHPPHPLCAPLFEKYQFVFSQFRGGGGNRTFTNTAPLPALPCTHLYLAASRRTKCHTRRPA